MLQRTTVGEPVAVHVPALEVTVGAAVPAGRLWVTVTPVLDAGPRLVTVTR